MCTIYKQNIKVNNIMLEMLLNMLSTYGTPYALGGVNALGLTALGNAIDAIVTRIPILQQAGIRGEYFQPFGSILYWNEIYEVMKQTNRQLGIAGEYGAYMEDAALGAYENIIKYGGEIQDVATAFRSLIDTYGRNVTLSEEELSNMGKLNVAFGDTYAQIFATNLLMGTSVKDTYKFLEKTANLSDKYGINIKKTLTNLSQNISLIDRTSFRNGVVALQQMAINAERMRIDMQSTISFAERMFDPDDAIEVAAQLQLMGGEFAKMGDVWSLMFEGRNNPEELQKRLFEVTRGVGRLNEMTGAIDIDALGASQLRAFAQITGQSMESLMQAARQIAKEDYISKIFTVNVGTQEKLDQAIGKVTSLANYDPDMGEWMIRVGEEYKSVSLLDEEDLKQLEAINSESEDVYGALIDSNRSLQQSMEILTAVIMRNLIGRELYDLADKDLKKTIQNLDDKILSSDLFKFSEAMIDSAQKETYKIGSKEINSLLEGDVAGFAGQIGENLFAPTYQLNETLKGAVERMGENNSVYVTKTKELIEKFDGTVEDIKKIRDHLKKIGDQLERIGNWFDKFNISSGKLFRQSLGGLGPMGGILGFTDLLKESKATIEPYIGKGKDEKELIQNNLTQGPNEHKVSGELNTNVKGSVKVSLEGGSIEKEIILNDPQLQDLLLEGLKPYLVNSIETRLHEFKQDSLRNNGLTNKPLIRLK